MALSTRDLASTVSPLSTPIALDDSLVPAGLARLLEGAEILSLAALREFGTTLVVAPHPDDESLGCGGLIALLQDAGQAVWALLVTDGSQSHPGSRRYDVAARRALRDAEWQAALGWLGVPSARSIRLGLVDGDVPLRGNAHFGPAAQSLRRVLDEIRPASIVLPWRRDPHPDHRATHALLEASIGPRPPLRCMEYMVWMAERAAAADLPLPHEVRTWQLDIASVVDRKRRAIACHRSQLGALITDDPGGFSLSSEMRCRAEAPVEYFFEQRQR